MGIETSRILIVDKDPKQAEIYTGFIREVTQTHIDIVPSAAVAAEKFAASQYQVVIVDAATDPDVFSSIEKFRGLNPNTGVIVISDRASVEDSVKSMRLGAEDYFPKPVNPDAFKLAVRRCVDRRDLYSGDAQVASLMNLINACQLISASLDERRVFETVMGYLRRETNCQGQAMYRYGGGKWERIQTSADSDVDVIDVAVEWSNFLESCRQENVSCKVLPKSKISPELLVFRFHWTADKECFAVCASPSLKRGVEEVFSMFKMMQVQLQVTGKNISNYLSVRDLLYRDDATSLHNSRYLSLSLDRAFEIQRAKGGKFAVLFVDVDRFKSVNDSHGHLNGTKLLHEVGECLKKEVRQGDTICRYGGDEFVVILQNVDLNTARDIAERIRVRVEQNKFLANENLSIHLTVSIGVAMCPDHARSKGDIVAAADTAMYAAKRTSKNLVYVAEATDKKTNQKAS